MDPKTAPTTRYRTITLTDRAPVRIVEADWPVIAQAREQVAGLEFNLHVRQHADGRTLIYGRNPGRSWRGGELLEPGADLAAAIRRVGASGQLAEPLIQECIAALPAEVLS